MIESKDHFYEDKPEPARSCLLALRNAILAFDEKLKESVKYGMPCFTLGANPICYLWTDKKSGEPYILFVDGQKLDFLELESGNRAKMKILRIDAKADLPLSGILKILSAAIALRRK